MKKIKLLKEIELNAIKKGKNIICYDMNTVNLVLGTSAAASNLHMYGVIKKAQREWVIPVTSIEKRIEKMQRDIDSYKTRMKLMKQVINNGSKRS